MRYEILGPLRVVDENLVDLNAPRKVQTVLAVLLIRAEQMVTMDQLISEIWGESVPRRAIAGIHVYISQLRKFLSLPGRTESPVITHSPGYLLRLGSDELDFRCFERLTKTGRDQLRSRRPEEAVASFESALALWRGPVLSNLHCGPLLYGFSTWLTEIRLECLEMLADAQLELGRHRELISLLYSLIAENPLRETFYRHLMLALYRANRQADALNVYQSARRVLSDELGLEPCRALQNLQHAILTGDEIPSYWADTGSRPQGTVIQALATGSA